MEDGESEEETVVREIYEELGIKVKPKERFLEYESDYDNSIQIFYTCEYIEGILGSGTGPEFSNRNEYTGVFEIKIVKLEDIKNLNLVPERIKEEIFGNRAILALLASRELDYESIANKVFEMKHQIREKYSNNNVGIATNYGDGKCNR